MDVVEAVENCEKGRGDKPTVPIIIADCGELPMEEETDAATGEAKVLRAEL